MSAKNWVLSVFPARFGSKIAWVTGPSSQSIYPLNVSTIRAASLGRRPTSWPGRTDPCSAASYNPTECRENPAQNRAWRTPCGRVNPAMHRGQAGTPGLGVMTIRAWRTHGARSNKPGTPADPQSPRKGSSRGTGDTLHHRCVGCETQGPPRRVKGRFMLNGGSGRSTPENPADRSRSGD